MEEKTILGVEFGSTRIKAVTIDGAHRPVSTGDYTWASTYENGVWTYSLDEVWAGLKAALRAVEGRQNIAAMGISAMMHGYLAFDKDWDLLGLSAPGRTPSPVRPQRSSLPFSDSTSPSAGASRTSIRRC